MIHHPNVRGELGVWRTFNPVANRFLEQDDAFHMCTFAYRREAARDSHIENWRGREAYDEIWFGDGFSNTRARVNNSKDGIDLAKEETTNDLQVGVTGY